MTKFYKISEVAEMLNLNWYTVWYWCKKGKFPAVCINRTYRIPAEGLERFLEENEIKKVVAKR